MTPEQYAAAGTWVAAFAALGTLGVAVWAAFYAKKQLDESQEMRLAQTRPYVVVSIGVEQQMLFMLVVENVGKVPAQNVRVQFDELPQSSIRELDDLRLLKEAIPTMPPGHRYRAYWESALVVFSEKEPYPYPMSYQVEVSYEDQQGHSFGPERHILDFRVYEGQAQGPKGLGELVKAVEAIAKQQKQWAQKGLRVRASNQDKAERRSVRPMILDRAIRAKRENGWAGLLRYGVEQFQRRHGLHLREPWRKSKG
jgi:hypothetical protein